MYALIDDELIVRSYQGPVACQKLRHHTGVCWAAVSTGETVIVPDVERFPGHIACNSKSRSEIVLPIRDREGRVFACLDVDSDRLDAFDREDEEGLKKILSLLLIRRRSCVGGVSYLHHPRNPVRLSAIAV